jgi:hypothetical protein
VEIGRAPVNGLETVRLSGTYCLRGRFDYRFRRTARLDRHCQRRFQHHPARTNVDQMFATRRIRSNSGMSRNRLASCRDYQSRFHRNRQQPIGRRGRKSLSRTSERDRSFGSNIATALPRRWEIASAITNYQYGSPITDYWLLTTRCDQGPISESKTIR